MELPHSSPVARVFHELSHDGGVWSVWLIGSRANGSATEASDWDLLVFQTCDPTPTEARLPNVDVLCVGPSGRILLEGKSAEYAFGLADLEWTETSEGVARYRGKRFVEYSEGQAVDSDAPRFDRPFLCAKRLWPKGSECSVNDDAHPLHVCWRGQQQ